MFFSHHSCINTNKHKSFNGLFHHLMEERININKGVTKKCQIAISKRLNVNREKEIWKTHWTSMMSMDIIHVHAEEGCKDGKVGGNIAPKTNDYLWMVHVSYCHVKPCCTKQTNVRMTTKARLQKIKLYDEYWKNY